MKKLHLSIEVDDFDYPRFRQEIEDAVMESEGVTIRTGARKFFVNATALGEDSPAEAYAQGMLARVNDTDEPLSAGDSYAQEPIRGVKYLVAGNGPTVWFYTVKGQGNQVEFGVVEHHYGHGHTFAVVPQLDAEVIDLALRTGR